MERDERERVVRDYADGKIDHKEFVERTSFPRSDAARELKSLQREVRSAPRPSVRDRDRRSR